LNKDKKIKVLKT